MTNDIKFSEETFMKLFSKLAVVAAALLLVSVFTGCNNSSSGSGPETLAVFEGISESYGYACTLTCYDDESWDLYVENTPVGSFTYAKGTYEGDPTKDGTFTYVIKQYVPAEVMMYQEKTTLTTIPNGGQKDSTLLVNGKMSIYTEMGIVNFTRK